MNTASSAHTTWGDPCPVCHARNPANRRTCDLCSAVLPTTVLCPNCGHPVREGERACSSCGRVQTPPEPVLPPPVIPTATLSADPVLLAGYAMPPSGFVAESLSPGRIRLRRTIWGRLNGNANIFLIMLFLGAFFLRTTAIFSGSLRLNPVVTLFALLSVILVAAVLWIFCLQEEWIVGRDYLARRCELFGYRWGQTIEGASVLRIETVEHGAWSRNGPRTIRTLRAQNVGGTAPLLQTTRHHGGLFSLSDYPFGDDDCSRLAAYLTRVTGWPTIDPHRGKF